MHLFFVGFVSGNRVFQKITPLGKFFEFFEPVKIEFSNIVTPLIVGGVFGKTVTSCNGYVLDKTVTSCYRFLIKHSHRGRVFYFY